MSHPCTPAPDRPTFWGGFTLGAVAAAVAAVPVALLCRVPLPF